MSAGPETAAEAIVTLPDVESAQAVFGPLHRHVALIHEAFRAPGEDRARGHVLDIHVHGPEVRLRGPAAEIARAQRIFDALLTHYRHRRRVREGEVLAAIAFAERNPDGGPASVELPQFGGLTLRTPRQVDYVRALKDPAVDLVFGVGPAGTGKTFLAVAAAVEALRSGAVDRIVVTRPAVEAGERLGFLPGALEEKVDPFLQPIWDAFRSQKVSEGDMKNRAKIEVAPIGFMRGRTLANAFVIVDEAQNATVQQMKMILTRLGEGSRMAVTGDPSQVDLPRMDQSGLAHALRILSDVEAVEVIRFSAADVVRHRLVARIIAAYDRDEAQTRFGGGDG